jgi:phage gpG-like protein
MFTVEINDRAAILRVASIKPKAETAIAREAFRLAIELQGRVKEALSGEVLNVQTGFLRAHVFQDVETSPDAVVGQVFTSGVKYAAVHEYGGQSAYVIEPKTAKALRWFSGGSPVFRKKVVHPPAKERSFMRYSLREMRDEIIKRMSAAVQGATK